MYVQERHNQIGLLLKNKESVSVEELSKKFGVSKATIRRDIKILHERGLLIRTHGGAIPNDHFVTPPKFKIREDHNRDIKSKLAKAAIEMIKPFDTLMVDGGTTTLQIAVELSKRVDLEGVTLVSNSIPVTLELIKNPKIKTILLGGYLAANELSTIGPLSLKNIDRFKATKTILGASGIDLKYGFTEGDEYICELKKRMLDLGEEKIVVTDSSKFGKIASFSLIPLNGINTIITDSLIDSETRKAIIQNGINLITV